jgi:hypothetical protein
MLVMWTTDGDTDWKTAMVAFGQCTPDYLLSHHHRQVSRLRAYVLDGFATFGLDLSSRVPLDPLGIRRHALLIFFHQALGALFCLSQQGFCFFGRGGQLGFVVLELALGL